MEDQEIATHQGDDANQAIQQITPEEESWRAQQGFTRKEWQKLIYARWRYRHGHTSMDEMATKQ